NGSYLMERLRGSGHFGNVRGKGLMIGFDLPAPLRDLRKHLLQEQHIFTGEAKPNVVRLLPALNITRAEIDEFLAALEGSVQALSATADSNA
ncbi:MAG: aminotransferase class III-fold pyridoxal phosphate-dependent enzyme, partial [Chitinophagaceae bacterium]